MSGNEFEEGNPDIAVDEAATTEPYRARRDRKRTPDRNERNPLVEMPSTPVFQASSTTVSAALARIGEATGGPINFGAPVDDGALEERAPASLVAPVFVLGGSLRERQLLAARLDAHPNVSVALESEVLVDAALALEGSLESLAHLGYPDQYWYKVVGDRFAAMQEARAAADGKGRWVEFLDAGAMPLGSLDRLFPRALVIKVVGTGWSRLGARSPRRTASRMTGGRCMEVRGGDLKTNPDGACRAILAFIGEGGSSANTPAAG